MCAGDFQVHGAHSGAVGTDRPVAAGVWEGGGEVGALPILPPFLIPPPFLPPAQLRTQLLEGARYRVWARLRSLAVIGALVATFVTYIVVRGGAYWTD